jgi:hypothetical protein
MKLFWSQLLAKIGRGLLKLGEVEL